MRYLHRLRLTRALALTIALLAAAASAQETRSVIFGRVVDPQSSAVVVATVVVGHQYRDDARHQRHRLLRSESSSARH